MQNGIATLNGSRNGSFGEKAVIEVKTRGPAAYKRWQVLGAERSHPDSVAQAALYTYGLYGEARQVHGLAVEFLTACREQNFGALARFPRRHLDMQGMSPNQIAGPLREDFERFVVSDFRVTELENTAPAIWLSRGEATMNHTPGAFECRWIIANPDGSPGYGSDSALWYLVFCNPYTMWRASE